MLQDQWAVIVSAPIPYLVAVIVVVGAVWGVINWAYSARLSGKDAEIDLLTRQRDDYKDKLGGATPDEAKAKIEALETRLSALEPRVAAVEPRRLTDTQRTTLSDTLKTNPGNVDISQDAGVSDIGGLTADLKTSFTVAGWGVKSSMVFGPSSSAPHGIGIRVPNPGVLTPRQMLIVQALKAAGISFDIQQGSPTVRHILPGQPVPPSLDAQILISQKVL